MSSNMNKNTRIFVAGHRGMVGSALMRTLQAEGYNNIITRSHSELDLIDQQAVKEFFRNEKIDTVFLAAAKVGGIFANNVYRADFIYENLMIECNVIQAAYKAGIKHLLFLGSSCIYPKSCSQPMKEEYLLSGYLEPTNEPYAVAKIAGIKLCESFNRQYGTNYRAVMPTNLYGSRDNFDLQSSHVLPAMIRKFHLAKLAINNDWDGIAKDEKRYGPIPEEIRNALECGGRNSNSKPAVKLWGTGSPMREFLYVDDMATACLFVMRLSDNQHEHALRPLAAGNDTLLTPGADKEDDSEFTISHLNIGSGNDMTIRELADLIKNTVNFQGDVIWDSTKPDGMHRKLLDISRLSNLGWKAEVDLKEGIRRTYDWYKRQMKS